MKENGSRLFGGLVLYVFIFNLTALCCMMLYELLWFYMPAAAGAAEKSRDGIISIITVIVSGVLTWQYYSVQNRRHDLYMTAGMCPEPESLTGIVFGKKRAMDLWTLVFCMACTVLAQEAAWVFDVWLEGLLNMLGYTAAYAPAAAMDYVSDISVVVYAALAAPLVEEIIFRGLLLKGLLPYGRGFAIVVSSVCFCLMHGDISQTFFTFLMGLLTAAVAAEYSLGWSFFLHFFNNGIYSGLLTAVSVVVSYEAAEAAIDVLVVLAAVVVVVFAVTGRRRIAEYLDEGKGQCAGTDRAGGAFALPVGGAAEAEAGHAGADAVGFAGVKAGGTDFKGAAAGTCEEESRGGVRCLIRGRMSLLVNVWFLMFVVFEVLETLSTLARLE